MGMLTSVLSISTSGAPPASTVTTSFCVLGERLMFCSVLWLTETSTFSYFGVAKPGIVTVNS